MRYRNAFVMSSNLKNERIHALAFNALMRLFKFGNCVHTERTPSPQLTQASPQLMQTERTATANRANQYLADSLAEILVKFERKPLRYL